MAWNDRTGEEIAAYVQWSMKSRWVILVALPFAALLVGVAMGKLTAITIVCALLANLFLLPALLIEVDGGKRLRTEYMT